MTARHRLVGPDQRSALERLVEKGIFAGLLASVAMGLFAMVASATYQGRGFFTPMYHAAFILDGKTLGVALDRAAAGEPFYFFREAFTFGAIAHVVVGGVLGALFALLAKALRLRHGRAIAGGIVYGLAVMVLMSAFVLPQVAALFGAGKPISQMGNEVGWGTFVAQFAVFGLALGLWPYLRPQDFLEAPAPEEAGGPVGARTAGGNSPH